MAISRTNHFTVTKENIELFSNLFQKGLEGKKLNIISPICPDYSVKKLMPGLYEFTFERLNSGIGVIGKRILILFLYLVL